MEKRTNYVLKLKALLHDPVHKIWSFSNVSGKEIKHKEVLDYPGRKWHEKVALDLFKFILEEDLDEEKVKKADQIASAFSRIVVAPNIKEEIGRFDEETCINFDEALYFDPLKGQVEQPVGCPESHNNVVEIFEKVGDLNFGSQEERAEFTFLFLWRFLPEIFPWVEKHPADSRAPNHSIYDHLVQTSAIVTCLDKEDKPSFLLFTLTPVQSFIATARKTSDLWAGSYLLSYLVFKSLEVIMDELGPDQIIFPNLRAQPFVDLWLFEKHFKNKNLDNRVFELWKNEWNKFIKGDNEEISKKLSIANIPNRFLAIVPYGRAQKIAKDCEGKIKETIKELLNSFQNDDIKPCIEVILQNILAFLKPYWVVVPFYNDSYTEVETIIEEYQNLVSDNELLEIIKNIKNHPYYTKTSNVGMCYSLLVELAEKFLASRKMIKNFDTIPPQRGEKCHLCGEYDILNIDWVKFFPYYVNKTERLCGLCLFKRILPEIIKKKFEIEVRYPSTSELPTVIHKKSLPHEKVHDFLNRYRNIFGNNLIEGVSVPALKNNPLYHIDGQWLMESSYREQHIMEELGKEEINKEQLEEMRKFLRDNQINPPVYYAILAMDGDNMGKWLNGAFLPKVKDLIHPKVVNILEYYGKEDENLYSILNSNHPMSPSFHNLFSRRLSEFALNDVRRIVEDEYYGKLIYSGGDDILSFLPVEKAIDCAYRLNERFTEVIGKKASMSAGIVFVHHKYPLSNALREVRDAEKLAKGKYGRNSVCIKYISGSGQSRITGMKWQEKEFFNELIRKYNTDELSSKFAYDFMEVVEEINPTNETTNEKPHYILTNELKRLYRHKLTKEKYDKEFEEKLIEMLNKFKNNYNAFGEMLIIARFVASMLCEGRMR